MNLMNILQDILHRLINGFRKMLDVGSLVSIIQTGHRHRHMLGPLSGGNS